MKKILSIYFLFILFCSGVFAENFSAEYLNHYSESFRSVTFMSADTVNFYAVDAIESDKDFWDDVTYNYTVEKKHKIYEITLNDAKRTKLVALISPKLLVLYEKKSGRQIFCGTEKRQSESIYFYPGQSFSASSELVENGKIYTAKNLGNLKPDFPWVEGVKGQGIGEKIFVDTNTPYLILFSGYFSVEKPYLYEYNSRPKTIKASVEKSGKSKIIELEDTPCAQQLDLKDIFDGEIFRTSDILTIEIVDVYPGTKYEDTCINALLTGLLL